MKFSTSAKISTIASASILYLQAAKRFADRATVLDTPAAVEGAAQEKAEEITAELVHTSLAAVMISNSAAEAIVNELFLESSVVTPGHWFKGVPVDVSRALFDAWKHGAERYELVTKCQIAAALFGKERVNFGGGSFQSMGDLIALRNILIHHKPISVEHGRPPHQSDDDIERRLANLFPRSQLCGSMYAFRWYGCLGAGCARWARDTVLAFEQDFFGHLGVGYVQP